MEKSSCQSEISLACPAFPGLWVQELEPGTWGLSLAVRGLCWRLPANCKFSSFWRWICSTSSKPVFQGKLPPVACLMAGSTCRDGILLLQICCLCCSLLCWKSAWAVSLHLRDGKTPLLFITSIIPCVYLCFKKPCLGCDQDLVDFCVFQVCLVLLT